LSEPVPVVVVQTGKHPVMGLAAKLNASGELLVVGELSSVESAARSSSARSASALLLVADDADAASLVATLMHSVRLPIVVLTQTAQGSLASMAAGAAEALPQDAPNERLVESLKLMSALTVVRRVPAPFRTPHATAADSVRLVSRPPEGRPRLVAIGASTGGPAALAEVLGQLPETFPAAIVVAQHMPDDYDEPFARWLSEVTKLRAKVVEDGEPLCEGIVYIPRGGLDLVVTRSGLLQNALPTRKGPVPSADRLLESVATLDGYALFGIILTGMGRDGMHGLKAMRLAGAATVAQDKASSVVPSMPESAVANGGTHLALPPAQIALQLLAWVSTTPPDR
jgi:two-component system chemotaxis response regulator CheB